MTVEKLRRRLEDPEKEEWEKALEVALLAFQWLQEAAIPERVGKGALRLLLHLSDLLSKLQNYIDSHLNDLISTAFPGPTLQEALEQGVARLGQAREEIARLQEALKQWQEQDAELEKQQRELDRLRAEVRRRELQKEELERQKEELEHLRKLADPQVVEALRQQVEGLRASLRPEGMEAQALEEALKQGAEQRLRLDERYLALLRPEVRSVLQRAEALEQERQEVLRQLEEAQSRYQEAQQKLERWKAELQPYVEADKLVAQAIPGANGVVALLEQAERWVKQAEEVLASVMEHHERETRRPKISLTGETLR